MKGTWLLMILMMVQGVTGYAHPIHVSITEIIFDEKDKELEIVLRIFTDDLESSIRKEIKQEELDLSEGDSKTISKLISDYLAHRFNISVNGKVSQWKYLGQEQEGLSTLCYLQVAHIDVLKLIKINNSVITELHEDQSNIINVTVSGNVRSLRLMRDYPSGELVFQ